MSQHHDLKIEPAFFAAVLSGDKTFEIRNNHDRGFQKGDTITLHELSKISPTLQTGRKFDGVITYVLGYQQHPGWVVFAFKPAPAREE